MSEQPGRPDKLVAFRIACDHWLTDERLDTLLTFLDRYRGAADQLAFFTQATHPPRTLDEVQSRAERLREVMPRVRAEGMAAGINLLATMGHHEENLAGSLDEPWQRVIDPHGVPCRGCYCPGSQELLGYVRSVYQCLAGAAPDFIWIDDDVRLAGHMPVGFTCFCPQCVERFTLRLGRGFTRETLVAAFEEGTSDERLALRREWLGHNRATIDHLFEAIEEAVHEVSPGLPLGFMTGDRFYEGYGFTEWAETLAGAAHSPVWWRPGGGFYSDEALVGLVGKAHDVGRQVAMLPPQVTVIQSEIENFPYDPLRKSARTTVVEAAAHMAAGATGAAFNVLSDRPDLGEYGPMLQQVHASRRFYERLHGELGRYPLVGVWPVWMPDVFAANSLSGSWPEGPADALAGLFHPYVLGEIGIPVCYGPQGAVVSALSGPGLRAFSPDKLQSIFSGGVLMDVSAWQALDELGLSEWTGITLGREHPRDAIEVLTDHALNGRFAGWSRDCRQSFYHETATELEPGHPGVEALARLTEYIGGDHGICMTAFSNSLGGRVVVMGYFPWSMMHSLAKSSQMKAVCEWLSGGELPAVTGSFARVHLWVRRPTPDQLACVLLNASLDPVPDPVLRVDGPYTTVQWTGMDGARVVLPPSESPGAGRCEIRTPPLDPWSLGLVTAIR